MAAHSNVLAWRIPWIENPTCLVGYHPWGLKRVRYDRATKKVNKPSSWRAPFGGWGVSLLCLNPIHHGSLALQVA